MKTAWSPQELSAKHKEITRLLTLGLDNKQVAENLRITPQTVSNIRNSPIGEDRLSILSGARDAETMDVIKEVNALLPKSVQVLKDLLQTSADPRLRFQSAVRVLDMSGYAPVKKFDVRSVSAVISAEDLAELKRRKDASSGKDVID